MSHLYYRLTDTTDPEERLEDAALYKALHDEFGLGLTLVPSDAPAPADGLFLGRGKRSEFNALNVLSPPGLPYWKDPAFLGSVSRSVLLTDLEGAEMEVERLHRAGKDAFLKSTRQKHFTGRIERGMSLHAALGGMIYSFIDREDCLLVQEAVEMKFERRFMVMNGKVVTQSPVAWHLTPMSRFRIQDETGLDVHDLHFPTPRSREARFSPKATHRMTEFAQAVADASENPHLCIDLAILGSNPETDPIEVIEFNPMQPGAVGLYACDPYRIAEAVWDAMDPELRETVRRRQRGEVLSDPVPAPEKLEDGAFDDMPAEGGAQPGIYSDFVLEARAFDSIKPLLVVDAVFERAGARDARQAALDLRMMMRHARDDVEYRRRLDAWIRSEASTLTLREIFREALGNGKGYADDSWVRHRIKNLDMGSLRARYNVEILAGMEDIRRLAVEYGARFADIREDEDLLRSYAWCATWKDAMEPGDLERYEAAVAARLEDLGCDISPCS